MKKIAILGAGPAGIEAAAVLAANNCPVTLFEKEAQPLCNITDKALLFPNFADAAEVAAAMRAKLDNPNITLRCYTEVTQLTGLTRRVQRILAPVNQRLHLERDKQHNIEKNQVVLTHEPELDTQQRRHHDAQVKTYVILRIGDRQHVSHSQNRGGNSYVKSRTPSQQLTLHRRHKKLYDPEAGKQTRKDTTREKQLLTQLRIQLSFYVFHDSIFFRYTDIPLYRDTEVF